MNIVAVNNFKPAFKANTMPKEQAEYLNDKLCTAESVDIFCHAKADEDSFNSAKVLYSYLDSMGKDVRIIAKVNPELYQFDQKKFNVISEDKVDESTSKADLAVCVDWSRDNRQKPNVIDYLGRFSNSNIIGFDHHDEKSLICPKGDTYKITESYESVKNMPASEPKNFYIDASSKSCAAILFRFFEALKRDIPYNEKLSLFCGMSDDMRKSGYINFFNSPDIGFADTLEKDKNTKEIYKEVLSDIDPLDKKEVIAHIYPMSEVSPLEEAFQKSLFDNVRFNGNNKFAYVVIDKDDENWGKLGGDNERTREIVKDFRSRLLQNSPDDPLISEDLRKNLKEVKVAGVVDFALDRPEFQVSLTSKGPYVRSYADYVNDFIDTDSFDKLKQMGHDDRGGWNIPTDDEFKCEKFFNYFLRASEDIDYDN